MAVRTYPDRARLPSPKNNRIEFPWELNAIPSSLPLLSLAATAR